MNYTLSVSPSRTAALAVATTVAVATAIGAPVGFCGLAAPSAAAHSVLVESSPSAGQNLSAPPTEIILTFNEDINPDFVAISVVGPREKNLVEGSPSVEGPRVSSAVAAGESGSYRAGYRVTSADGHVIEGTLDFRVAGSTKVESSNSDTPRDENSVAPAAGKEDSQSNAIQLWPIGLVALVLIAGAGVFALRNKRTR